MKFVSLCCLAALMTATPLLAEWNVVGDPKSVTFNGDIAQSATTVTLDVPASAKSSSARFGPIRVDSSARAINLRAYVDPAFPKSSKFRLTVVLTSQEQFPEDPSTQLGRSNRVIQSGEKGTHWLNVAMPRSMPSRSAFNAFIEIASGELDRSGKPGPAKPGRLSVSGINLLPSVLPATSDIARRRASFLEFYGRHTLTGTVGRVNTKSALRMPGLLAAISNVKSSQDPRLDCFIAENITIVKAMRDNKLRTGPFEIFFPIANFVAARRMLGPTLMSHPRYAEYEKAIFDFQCTWPDYKSNADGWPKRQIREAKSISDVPASIDTGNFRLLVTAAGYLSAQEFPHFKTTLTNPKSGEQRVIGREVILREMNLYIRRVYHSIASNNTWEYGSQTYLAIDFAPIHLIALHAKDPDIRRIAAHTLDCLYSSLAASLNRGHYINSAGRSKGEFLGTGSGMGFLGWLMFGDARTYDAMTTPFLVYAALPGSYQVPPAIQPAKAFPFVKRERIGDDNNFVCIYTYQSKSFGLTSTIESRNPGSRTKPSWDRDGFYKEASRHKLNWTGGNSGGFAPQWQNSMQPYAGRRNKPNGNYYGLNPWSQVAQQEGTQIGLADVSEGYPFRQLYAIYPNDGSIRKRVFHAQSGWTICHTGGTLFAFRSLKPATQTAEPGPDKASTTDRFDYKKTAWILEVIDAPVSPGTKPDAAIAAEMDHFHSKLLKARIETEHLDDADKIPPKFTYTSPVSGRSLHLDASIYPVPADGSGMAIEDYPVLATYPKATSAPSVRQTKEELLWLDDKGVPTLRRVFADWIK